MKARQNTERRQMKQKKQKRPVRRVRKPAKLSAPRQRAAPSCHAYLDPFFTRGHVPCGVAHAPYVMIESTRKWVTNLAANTHSILCVMHTPSVARGFQVNWTGALDATGICLTAKQLGTVQPTHISQQRLGISIQNVTTALTRAGVIYVASLNDPQGVTFSADNAGDAFTRITNAQVTALADRIKESALSRAVSSQSSSTRPIKGICTLTRPDEMWYDFNFIDIDPASAVYNDLNIGCETNMATANLLNYGSCFYAYFPANTLAQDYSFELVSQDGCRFDPDHALYGTARHAPMVPSHIVAQLHTQAHVQSHLGERAPVQAQAHESFMSRVGNFVSEVGTLANRIGEAVPRIGGAIYNTVQTSRVLRSLGRAAPIIEEVAESVPLLL